AVPAPRRAAPGRGLVARTGAGLDPCLADEDRAAAHGVGRRHPHVPVRDDARRDRRGRARADPDASTGRGRGHPAGPARRRGPGDRPVVVSVSRLVRRKGQDNLLRAWPRVLAAVPDAALLIVGDGPMRATLAERAERDHPDSVVVTGPVSADQLPGHYAAADL